VSQTSINPNKINPMSPMFRVVAGDLDFMLEDHGLDLNSMDPHLWVAIRDAVDRAMSNVWADTCATAIEMVLREHDSSRYR